MVPVVVVQTTLVAGEMDKFRFVWVLRFSPKADDVAVLLAKFVVLWMEIDG